jgi:hypothetical protein
MSIDLDILLGHNLKSPQIAGLPKLLNQYFLPYAHQIQVRTDHGYTGQIVECMDGSWGWQEDDSDDEWKLQLGKLIEEDLWQWGECPKEGESFDNWFQEKQSHSLAYLVGCYGMIMFVYSNSVVLSTDIRWNHFIFDRIVQTDIKQFTRYLANCLGVRSAIYVPGGIEPYSDFDLTNGFKFEQIVSWFQDREPPAKSIKAMIATAYYKDIKCWTPKGYYVENFV